MKLYNVSITVKKPSTPKGRKEKNVIALPPFEVKLELRELFPVKKCKEGHTTEFGRIFTEETFKTIFEINNSLQDKSYHAYCMCPKRLIKPMQAALKEHLKVKIAEHKLLMDNLFNVINETILTAEITEK